MLCLPGPRRRRGDRKRPGANRARTPQTSHLVQGARRGADAESGPSRSRDAASRDCGGGLAGWSGVPPGHPRVGATRRCGRSGVARTRRAPAAWSPCSKTKAPSPACYGGGQESAAAPHHQRLAAQRQSHRARHVPARLTAIHMRQPRASSCPHRSVTPGADAER